LSLVRPDDTIYLRGAVGTTSTGIFTQAQIISFQGYADANGTVHGLRITSAPGETPLVQNSFFLSGAQYVTIDGLKFTQCANQWGGVVLQGNPATGAAAANNVIRNNDISLCGTGVFFWGDNGTSNNPSAGPNNSIVGNAIHDNAGPGINLNGGANLVNTMISGNTISNNGWDGIIITGNDTIVEYNIVYNNGKEKAGTSGIRTDGGVAIYDGQGNAIGGTPTGFAQNNIIRYNVVYAQSDHGGRYDGVGIELDLYSKGNQVYFNDLHFNDGAGIELIAAESNWVFNNTLYHNSQASDQSFPSELVLTGASFYQATLGATSYSGNSINNVVANNLVAARSAAIPSIYLDLGSIGNTLGNQLIVPDASGAFETALGGSGGILSTWTDIGAWNAAKGQQADTLADPHFVNPSAETAATGVSRNLSLQSGSRAFEAGLSPLTLPTPISVVVDLWQQLSNPSPTNNVNPVKPPIGAYTVDP
jgi:parallel beta-helix repeat protein